MAQLSQRPTLPEWDYPFFFSLNENGFGEVKHVFPTLDLLHGNASAIYNHQCLIYSYKTNHSLLIPSGWNQQDTILRSILYY